MVSELVQQYDYDALAHHLREEPQPGRSFRYAFVPVPVATIDLVSIDSIVGTVFIEIKTMPRRSRADERAMLRSLAARSIPLPPGYWAAHPFAPDFAEFQRLTDEWRKDTRGLSMSHQIAMNPAYQQIIGMGHAVLPYILRELQQRLDHWFWALAMITRASPVPADEAGNLRLMRDRWLEWGRQHGLIA